MSIAEHARNAVVVSFALGLVTLASCRQTDNPPVQPSGGYPSPTAPQPYGYPPSPAPWAPPPQNARPTLPPSFGFFCASDSDMQCPYGHCIGGRCGGCSDASQCKPGAACVPSPVGMTCWPGQAAPAAPLPPPGPTPVAPPPAPAGNDPFAHARQLCVDRINSYRARLSRAPLTRDPGGEPCVDSESRADARSNTAHGTFGQCGEHAQDACPNYPGPVEDGLVSCLEQMFAEGPGGGHYENMINAKYTHAFCGFEALSGGRFWMIQDFR